MGQDPSRSAPFLRIKVEGLWVTKLEVTLLDLGSTLDEELLEDALESALRRSLTSFEKLQTFIETECARGRRGCASLRNLMAQRGDIPATESRFETRFNRLLRNAGLPLPARQVEIFDGDRFIGRVDFAYPAQRVVIEADGSPQKIFVIARTKSSKRCERRLVDGSSTDSCGSDDAQRRYYRKEPLGLPLRA